MNTKYNNTELYSHIDFQSMTNLFNKLVNNPETNGKININYINKNITPEELEKVKEIYEYLTDSVNEHFDNFTSKFPNMKSFQNNMMFKLFQSWKTFLYIKDTRTPEQLIANVEKGWKMENFIFNKTIEYGFKCEMGARDKDRIPSLFNFDSTPDLKINHMPVEVQYGQNNFFKQNKLNTCIKKNALLIYYDTTLKKFHLFTQNEIRDIEASPVVTSYGYKKGKNFNKNNYIFRGLEEELRKSFISSKKKNSTKNIK